MVPAISAVQKPNSNAPVAYADYDDENEISVDPEMRGKQHELINSLPLDMYELDGEAKGPVKNDKDTRWAEAEKQIRDGGTATVSVKSNKKRKVDAEEEEAQEDGKKSKKDKRDKEKRKSHSEKSKKKSKA